MGQTRRLWTPGEPGPQPPPTGPRGLGLSLPLMPVTPVLAAVGPRPWRSPKGQGALKSPEVWPGSCQVQAAKCEFPSRHTPGPSTRWPSLRPEAPGGFRAVWSCQGRRPFTGSGWPRTRQPPGHDSQIHLRCGGPTFTVWSREEVATRARGPPKPQCRSVMGRVWRDQTCRGDGVLAGSTCSTLCGGHGPQRGEPTSPCAHVATRPPKLSDGSPPPSRPAARPRARGAHPPPAQAPHQHQAVLAPRQEVAAVPRELQARHVLVVAAQDDQEAPRGDLRRAHPGQRETRRRARPPLPGQLGALGDSLQAVWKGPPGLVGRASSQLSCLCLSPLCPQVDDGPI